MSQQQKLFQLYCAMIEMLMSKKYNFVAHLVPITLTRSNLNKINNFLSQLPKFNIVTSSLMKILESKNKVFYQYRSESLKNNYFFLLCKMTWRKKIKAIDFAENKMDENVFVIIKILTILTKLE